MPLTIGELLLECGLKMVKQEQKIKKLKSKVARLKRKLQSQQQAPESSPDV